MAARSASAPMPHQGDALGVYSLNNFSNNLSKIQYNRYFGIRFHPWLRMQFTLYKLRGQTIYHQPIILIEGPTKIVVSSATQDCVHRPNLRALVRQRI